MAHDVNSGCEEKFNNLKEALDNLNDKFSADHDKLTKLDGHYEHMNAMSTETRDNIEKIKTNLNSIVTKDDIDKLKTNEIDKLKNTVTDVIAIQNSTVNKLVEITKSLDNKSIFKSEILKNVVSAIVIAVIIFVLSQAFSNLFKKETDLNDSLKVHKNEMRDIHYGSGTKVIEPPSDNR